MRRLLLLVLVVVGCNATPEKAPCAVTVADRDYVRTLKDFDRYWAHALYNASYNGLDVRPLVAQRDSELQAIWQQHADRRANAFLADSVARCR